MPLSHGDLLQLKRWNTPTIYNGWEQITAHDVAAAGWNPDETRDFMPQICLLYTSPSPRDGLLSRMPSSA